MASKRQEIRELRAELQECRSQLAAMRDLARRGWEMQVTIAALLEHAGTGGAIVLPLEVRREAIDGEWGYEAYIEEDDPYRPMLLTVHKPNRNEVVRRAAGLPPESEESADG